MAQNFIACDREQELLLPPSLREWLPEDHLAWFVLDAVDAIDLSAFLAAYRVDGWGRAAHDPAMMVALLLYVYAVGERSSRRIERRCLEDVAVRVICANQAPDHCTIARFRQRHETALGELFGEVLQLCADAGLVRVGVIAIDGTKVHANASQHATRDYEQIAREILAEAAEVDELEDEQFGEKRGDELPDELATAQGRRGWLREAKRRLDDKRAEQARPIARSRSQRLKESRRRLEQELDVECRANAAYEAYRARGVIKDGRRFGGPPKPYTPPPTPEGKINVTDPDSRNVKTPRGWVQGYNAQAVCTEQQIVIAAEVTVSSPDFGHLGPMVSATENELARVGISTPPEVVLADAGYSHSEQIERLTGRGTVVLIPPDAGKRKGARPGWDGGLYTFMRRVLASERGGELYAKRQGMIEPIFAGHEVQSAHRPLPTPRQVSLPLGMAADHGQRQPAQAPPAHHKPGGGLTRHARGSHEPTRGHRAGRFRGNTARRGQSRQARPVTNFAQQPPWKAAASADGPKRRLFRP